ncbi:MAG: C25 family cysteine peptidase [Promethearchaeota archaeon]
MKHVNVSHIENFGKKSRNFLLLSMILFSGISSILVDSLSFDQINSYQPIASNFSPKIKEAASNDVDYLIITTADFKESLNPLATWKTQRGVRAYIITIEDIQTQYTGVDLPAKIKSCIKDFYENNNTKWILLGGDVDFVPTRYARIYDGLDYDGDYVCCDSYYTDLDHNWDSNGDGLWGTPQDNFDYIPEVYVGRLTASNPVEMQGLVINILTYERDPLVDDWMTKALYAGAMTMFDSDFDNDSVCDYTRADGNRYDHFLGEQLPSTMHPYYMGETEGLEPTNEALYPINESLTELNLHNQLAQGAGLSYILGHGNPQSMYRISFGEDYDGDGLFDYDGNPITDFYASPVDYMKWDDLISVDNTNLDLSSQTRGFYYLGGCSTGSFNRSFDCLQEMFLKDIGIGCIAGSEVVWGEDEWYERDYGGWYSDGLSFRFFEQLLDYNQPGKAFALAKQDYLEDRISTGVPVDFPGWEAKTLAQFNLLGDPEIRIWLDKPTRLNYTLTDIGTNSTLSSILSVYNTSESSIANATITIMDLSGNLLWIGTTNSSGELLIPFNSSTLQANVITASKDGYLPNYEPIEYNIITSTSTNTSTNTPSSNNDTGFHIPGYTGWIFGLAFFMGISALIGITYSHRLEKRIVKKFF